MNNGSDGSISPISKVLQEVIGLVRANGLGDLLTGLGGQSSDEGSSAETSAKSSKRDSFMAEEVSIEDISGMDPLD